MRGRRSRASSTPASSPPSRRAREVLEEASVVAVPERLAWVNTLPPMQYENGDQAQYLDHTFRFRWVSGEPTPGDDENTEAAFFALDALPPMSVGDALPDRAGATARRAGRLRVLRSAGDAIHCVPSTRSSASASASG